MAFETLEATDCFERAQVACHQVVDRDITEVVRRYGRQHPKSDVRRRSAQENFPHWHFLNIIWRQPGGLRPDKIIKISPGSSRGGAQEPPIVRRQNSAAPAFRRTVDHNYRDRKESPQKEERRDGHERRCSQPRCTGEKKQACSRDPKPGENELLLLIFCASMGVLCRLPFQ